MIPTEISTYEEFSKHAERFVETGFKLLLSVGDDFSYLDLLDLTMQSPSFCMLGQRNRTVSSFGIGWYSKEIERLGLSANEAIAYGFHIPIIAMRNTADRVLAYALLKELWEKKVTEYRSRPKPLNVDHEALAELRG